MLVASILAEKGSFVATTTGDAAILDAARGLTTYGVGALVVTSDGTSIEGIISERDIAHAIARHGADALGLPVRDVMTADVRTCGPLDTCDTLMRLMTEQRTRHVPVMEDAAMVGLVSIGDVVKRRVDELQVESQVLHEYLYSGR